MSLWKGDSRFGRSHDAISLEDISVKPTELEKALALCVLSLFTAALMLLATFLMPLLLPVLAM